MSGIHETPDTHAPYSQVTYVTYSLRVCNVYTYGDASDASYSARFSTVYDPSTVMAFGRTMSNASHAAASELGIY